MENVLKKIRINNVIAAILAILTGVVFVVFRQNVADMVAILIGVVLIAVGVLFIMTYIIRLEKTAYELGGLLLGALVAVLGLVILMNPRWFESVVALILGIIILVSGIESIMSALSLWKRDVKSWWIWFILSLVTVIAGLVLIIRRYVFSGTLIMICGIFFIYDGITSLIISVRLASALKAIRQDLNAVDGEAVIDGEKVTAPEKAEPVEVEPARIEENR